MALWICCLIAAGETRPTDRCFVLSRQCKQGRISSETHPWIVALSWGINPTLPIVADGGGKTRNIFRKEGLLMRNFFGCSPTEPNPREDSG
jgi:hypothetical protein